MATTYRADTAPTGPAALLDHLAALQADASAGASSALATWRAKVGLATRPPLTLEELSTNWMDRALAAQTYAGRPMTTHHVLDTAVPFHRGRLLAAVDELVRSVPALRSVLRESPLGVRRYAAPERWSALESIVTFSERPMDLSGSEWLAREFDLANEEPLRLLHTPRIGGGYQLVFTLHHGVTDGVGALALFSALMASYGALAGHPRELPAAVKAGSGRLRQLVKRPGGGRLLASLLLDNVRRASRFTDRRASLLEREEAAAGPLHYAVLDLPLAKWDRLRERASAVGCTRNDMMLTALLRAAAAWRRERNVPDEDFRALVPVDLRRELGLAPSLGNHLGVIEADFSVAEVDDASLPRTVAARLKSERAPSRVLATPMALAMLTALPPTALRSFFRWLDERPSSFMYSFLFSHIRVADGLCVPPSSKAERVYCLSSLPRQPGVGVTVTALPGSVTVALAYTPPRLSDEGAARLLALFATALDAV